MLNWTRAFSLVAISSLVTMSGRGQTADPPLFTIFKTFGADSGADEAAIKKAVEAAGGQVSTLPGHDNFTTRVTWENVTDGKRIALDAYGFYFRAPTARFERHVTTCSVTDYSRDTAGVDATRDWVAVPLSKKVGGGNPNCCGLPKYEYTYRDVAGVRSAIPSERWFDTDDTWWLETDYAPVGPITVRLSHNRRYLRGTVPGPSAPTSN